MTGSFLDILPPEAHDLLGVFGLISLLAGLLIWATGVKIARFTVTMLLGASLSALGTTFLPRLINVSPLTGAILGFVAGALLGALAFRILQGLVLALCLGLLVAGIYYRWHTPHQPTTAPTTLTAPDLLIPTSIFPATRAASAKFHFEPDVLLRKIGDKINAIPRADQKRMLIAALGSAAIALLVAFGFPRLTTWTITSLLGSLMILSGSYAHTQLYAPQDLSDFPATPISSYLLLAFLFFLGLLIQHHLFPPKHPHDRPDEPPRPNLRPI